MALYYDLPVFKDVDGTNSRYLNFNSSDAYMSSYFRANGYSVRCLQD